MIRRENPRRIALTDEQVKENALTYCEQIFKVLDREKMVVRFNSEWLSKINLEEFIRIAVTVTVARMLERDDFWTRYNNGVRLDCMNFSIR